MPSSSRGEAAYLQPREVFTTAALRDLAERIKSSGVLGRSSVYGLLLDYLIDCSLADKSPKEIEIGIEALGKGPDFDVSKDSTVRVYVHQLRKKLDKYYESHESETRHRIVIPRGQYSIAATEAPAGAQRPTGLSRIGRLGLTQGLMATLIILLLINFYVMLNRPDAGLSDSSTGLTASAVWNQLLDDELPILLVMGDYYIFGELNETGNIGRMVRDFNINSREDLEARHFSDWETSRYYQDLNLSYMPEGSAYALARIIPLLSNTGKMLRVTMMSDLTTADLRENHIVYIGYISALDKLGELVFAVSGLRVGRSYDELQNLESGNYYTSDAGLPEEGQQFRDYGFFSTFPASSENQVLVIGGMRDAGLMYTAQTLSDTAGLRELNALLSPETADSPGVEAVYEVYGVDRTQFNGRLVYSKALETGGIWGQNLTGSDY